MNFSATIFTILIASFFVLTLSATMTNVSGSAKINTRYRFKPVRINVDGNCPDSIEATILDFKTKDTLRYYVKNSGSGSSGSYITVKADINSNLITGQLVNCSLKTIGVLLNLGDSSKPTLQLMGQ